MKVFPIKKAFSYLSSSGVFGVDLNSSEIKIFQFKTKRGCHQVKGWIRKSLPKGMVDDLEVIDRNHFPEFFLDTINHPSGGKIRGNELVLAVPESKVFLRTLTLPLMEDAEAEEAVKWEMEANIPVAIDEVYFDYQVVERKEKEMKVLVVASSRKTIDNLVEVFSRLGYKICALEVDSLAIKRSILSADETRPIFVIDIGACGTGYYIYHNGYPVFSSSGSISGRLFTDVLEKNHGWSYQRAEQHKLRVGLGQNLTEREAALKIYEPLLSTLSEEIDKTASFYEETLMGGKSKMETLVLSGGGSNLKGLTAYLALKLKKTIVQGNPWENVQLAGKIPPISQEEAQSYITAIGLALWKS